MVSFIDKPPPTRYIDVASICRKYGGGGHDQTGGFVFKGDIKDLCWFHEK